MLLDHFNREAMMIAAKKIFLVSIVLAVVTSFNQIYAQSSNTQVFEEGTQDLVIVLASGAFGAILGLSTLSFVEKPEEHLRSVVVGGALGIIFGVATVAYMQADKSKQMYLGNNDFNDDLNSFSTTSRKLWHSEFSPKPAQVFNGAYLQRTFTF